MLQEDSIITIEVAAPRAGAQWLSLTGVTGTYVGDLAHDYLKTALPIT